jgi:hypothetical protein
MSDCPQVEAMLDELALDVLPGDHRAVVLAHVEVCPACRALLNELSDTADALLLAAPRSEPPPGFAGKVLRRRAARPRRRPRFAAVAAVAAAVVLVAGGVGVGMRIHEPDELRTFTLVSTNGGDVGDVSAYADSPPWFFIRVDRALPSGTYRCVLDVDGGRTVVMGTLFVSEGRGGWGQRVGVDLRRVRAARLLDAAGTAVATASFH